MKKLYIYFVILGFFLLILASPHAFADNIIFKSNNAELQYQVEVAKTDIQRAQGLMFRTFLPEKSGMVFLYSPPKIVNMWMKNTLIPLDMVFVNENGEIIHIHHNAIPEDLTSISSEYPVSYVIEINGGEIEKYGIRKGDRVVFSFKE